MSLVYSTETGRILPKVEKAKAPAGDGIVRIKRETKGRNGKGVTTIAGLTLDEKTLKTLATDLKKLCGVGGSVKDFIIEIQGDHREKIKAHLEKAGHSVKLAGG